MFFEKSTPLKKPHAERFPLALFQPLLGPTPRWCSKAAAALTFLLEKVAKRAQKVRRAASWVQFAVLTWKGSRCRVSLRRWPRAAMGWLQAGKRRNWGVVSGSAGEGGGSEAAPVSILDGSSLRRAMCLPDLAQRVGPLVCCVGDESPSFPFYCSCHWGCPCETFFFRWWCQGRGE